MRMLCLRLKDLTHQARWASTVHLPTPDRSIVHPNNQLDNDVLGEITQGHARFDVLDN
jgi:hypothetical protein